MRCILCILLVFLLLIPSISLSDFAFNLDIEQYPTIEIQEVVKVEVKDEHWIEAEVTAYSAGDGNTPGVIMASGKHVYEGAVAYNGLPLGSVLEIEGRQYVVEDRCKYDDTVDIYMNEVSRAYQWGRQWRKVKVVE